MEIIVGKLAGFCRGVECAIDGAEKTLTNSNKKVYCLGEMIHNEEVIKDLESKGMITVKSLDDIPNDCSVIFRAHGEAEKTYELAKEKNLEIIDLTCAKVTVLHLKVKKERGKSFIIIIGKKNHPETIGTKGYAGETSFIVESEDDILDAYKEYEKTNLGKLYVVAQTTFSSSKFDEIASEIEHNFAEAEVFIDKTICSATEDRQAETRNISKTVNKMIIIGGKHSSNTKELAKIAEENCGKVYLVQTVNDLEGVEFNKEDKVGIMAGASTPEKSIQEVIEKLKSIDK